eukprot:5863391-Prymnesium_polylepis.1
MILRSCSHSISRSTDGVKMGSPWAQTARDARREVRRRQKWRDRASKVVHARGPAAPSGRAQR